MLTKIILDGEFAKVAKQKEWMLDCNSAAEAIQLISVNTGGAIRNWIRQHIKDYKICEVECTDENGKSEKLVTETFQAERKCKTIRFLPLFTGAGGGNGGILQAIAGVVMIVVGVIACCWEQPWGANLIAGGIGLLISGVCTMLINNSQDDDDDDDSNYYFSGAVNTTRQGNPVPLVFGRCRVGSAVISSGIDVTEA